MPFHVLLLLVGTICANAIPHLHRCRPSTTDKPQDTILGSTGPMNFRIHSFGGSDKAGIMERIEHTDSRVAYKGNVGNPYGSNVLEIAATSAKDHQYVVQFNGPRSGQWTVVVWNKIGPDGKLDGWFGNACKEFTIDHGQIRYLAFEENSQGGWAASPGPNIPVDSNGGYSSTWGEFDFGSSVNSGWSGFDVSAIAPQYARQEVQGMKICDTVTGTCSTITSNASFVQNAYIYGNRNIGGIGGNLPPGPVKLVVYLDFDH